MSRLLLVGGFTESRRILEPVAEAVADPDMDVTVLTLREAVATNEERMRKLVAGAHVLTHSAGATALPDARGRSSDQELPTDLLVVAGPEPRFVDTLRTAAKTKTLSHVFGPTPHRRRDHLRVIASNAAEMVAHPIVNTGLIDGISKFSTVRAFSEKRLAAQSRAGNFLMSDDEFYHPQEGWRDTVVIQDLIDSDTMIEEIKGNHDELLLDPEGVFAAIGEAIQSHQHRRMYGV